MNEIGFNLSPWTSQPELYFVVPFRVFLQASVTFTLCSHCACIEIITASSDFLNFQENQRRRYVKWWLGWIASRIFYVWPKYSWDREKHKIMREFTVKKKHADESLEWCFFFVFFFILIISGSSLFSILDSSSRRVIVVISADLAHTHSASGPYGYSNTSEPFDEVLLF